MKCKLCDDRGRKEVSVGFKKRSYLYCTCRKGQKLKEKKNFELAVLKDESGTLSRINNKRIARKSFIAVAGVLGFMLGMLYLTIRYGYRIMN